MDRSGRKSPTGLAFRFSSLNRFFGRWHIYMFVPFTVLWMSGFMTVGQGAYTLWLKSNKQYNTVQVNNYTAITPGLGIIWIWTFAWLVDRFGTKARVPVIGVVTLVGFIANLAFVLYPESAFGWKWFAVAVGYIEVALSPLVYSWANIACAGDAEERAFVISSMLAVGTAFVVWVPLLAFKTVEAPKFFKGYVMQIVMQPVFFGFTLLLFFIDRWDARKKARKALEAGETSEAESGQLKSETTA